MAVQRTHWGCHDILHEADLTMHEAYLTMHGQISALRYSFGKREET